jgi:D-sedoheptulose 7-phosphate isomerase
MATPEIPTTSGGNPDTQGDAISILFQGIARNLELVSKDSYVSEIHRAIELLSACFRVGGKLLVFGNGGSSADAQHICAELVGRFMDERKALPAIALSANQAVLTAWSNDHGFDTAFSRQVEALGRSGDIAWGISTSGNSSNVVEALRVSRDRGLCTIGLTGKDGGRMAQWCDVLMAVPLTETPRIQEVHLATYHAICAAVESHLFGECKAELGECESMGVKGL